MYTLEHESTLKLIDDALDETLTRYILQDSRYGAGEERSCCSVRAARRLLLLLVAMLWCNWTTLVMRRYVVRSGCLPPDPPVTSTHSRRAVFSPRPCFSLSACLSIRLYMLRGESTPYSKIIPHINALYLIMWDLSFQTYKYLYLQPVIIIQIINLIWSTYINRNNNSSGDEIANVNFLRRHRTCRS